MCPPSNDEIWLKEYLATQFKAQADSHARTDEKLSELRKDSQIQHDDHSDRLGKIENTLGRLTDTVELHEKRSTTLEAAIKPLLDERTLEEKIKSRKIARWKTILASLGGLSALAEILRALFFK